LTGYQNQEQVFKFQIPVLLAVGCLLVELFIPLLAIQGILVCFALVVPISFHFAHRTQNLYFMPLTASKIDPTNSIEMDATFLTQMGSLQHRVSFAQTMH
jgi:hypothetical protein